MYGVLAAPSAVCWKDCCTVAFLEVEHWPRMMVIGADEVCKRERVAQIGEAGNDLIRQESVIRPHPLMVGRFLQYESWR